MQTSNNLLTQDFMVDATTGECLCRTDYSELFTISTIVPSTPDTSVSTDALFFQGRCTADKSMASISGCLKQVKDFFQVGEFWSTLESTGSNFGTYRIKFFNTDGDDLTSDCLAQLKAEGFIFSSQVASNFDILIFLGGYLPQKKANKFATEKIDFSKQFQISLPITDLNLCLEQTTDKYKVAICQTTILVSMDAPSDVYPNEKDTKFSFQLFQKDIEAQLFYDLMSNENTKNVLVERHSNNCTDCKLTIPEDIIFNMCFDKNCTKSDFNSTIPMLTNIDFFFSAESPLINFDSKISDIKVLVNSTQLASTAYNLTDSKLGINKGKMLELNFTKLGETKLEFRIYIAKDTVVSKRSKMGVQYETTTGTTPTTTPVILPDFAKDGFYTVSMAFNITALKGTGVIDKVTDKLTSTFGTYLIYVIFAVIALIILIVACLCFKKMRSKKVPYDSNPFEGDGRELQELGFNGQDNLGTDLIQNQEYPNYNQNEYIPNLEQNEKLTGQVADAQRNYMLNQDEEEDVAR